MAEAGLLCCPGKNSAVLFAVYEQMPTFILNNMYYR